MVKYVFRYMNFILIIHIGFQQKNITNVPNTVDVAQESNTFNNITINILPKNMMETPCATVMIPPTAPIIHHTIVTPSTQSIDYTILHWMWKYPINSTNEYVENIIHPRKTERNNERLSTTDQPYELRTLNQERRDTLEVGEFMNLMREQCNQDLRDPRQNANKAHDNRRVENGLHDYTGYESMKSDSDGQVEDDRNDSDYDITLDHISNGKKKNKTKKQQNDLVTIEKIKGGEKNKRKISYVYTT